MATEVEGSCDRSRQNLGLGSDVEIVWHRRVGNLIGLETARRSFLAFDLNRRILGGWHAPVPSSQRLEHLTPGVIGSIELVGRCRNPVHHLVEAERIYQPRFRDLLTSFLGI